jgi:hypothetical protein
MRRPSRERIGTSTRWPVAEDDVNVWRLLKWEHTFAGMQPTPYGIIRMFLGTATWGSVGLAILTRDARWFVASGAFGTIWWTADSIVKWVVDPLGDFVGRLLRGDIDMPPATSKLTVDDTVRLLESHIEGEATRSVQIQAAMRLSDLYRVVYKDEIRARAVLDRVRSRFPDAAELKDVSREL